MITYEEIKNNEEIKTYIRAADASMISLGFTEHSFAHVVRCADVAGSILTKLGYDERTVELGKIAAYMHDIGNVINRIDHAQSGAVMAFRILDKLGIKPEEIAKIVCAIGNHDEGSGIAVNAIAAALTLGDKTDVRSSRVRNTDISFFDIHDRVNYSVTHSEVTVNKEKTQITLTLTVDTDISPVIDYFQIFMDRMIMCRNSAQALGLQFELIINGQSLM